MAHNLAATIRDAFAIAAVGAVVGLVGNAVSPRGLSLTRDYFRTAPAAAATEAALDEHGSRGLARRLQQEATTPTATAAATTKRGLPRTAFDDVARAFRDPQFGAGRIMFVDARSRDRFAAGHIRGAYPFDHYRPDEGVAAVLAAAQVADRIVVYCHGGDCEDSELATLDLISLGVPPSKLVIYGGGITEWQQRGMPVETGPRAP